MKARAVTAALCALVLATACSGEVSERPATQPVSVTPTATGSATGTRQAALDTQLIAAAWDNDVGRARTLIEQGADVNAKDDSVQSAYLISTSEGYLDLLELTLSHGGDVNAKDSYNGTGLIRAADRGHADIVGRLVRAGIELDHVNNLGWTALLEAVILGDGSKRYQETVQILLDAGADRSVTDRDGVTALEHAQRRGQRAVADILQD